MSSSPAAEVALSGEAIAGTSATAAAAAATESVSLPSAVSAAAARSAPSCGGASAVLSSVPPWASTALAAAAAAASSLGPEGAVGGEVRPPPEWGWLGGRAAGSSAEQAHVFLAPTAAAAGGGRGVAEIAERASSGDMRPSSSDWSRDSSKRHCHAGERESASTQLQQQQSSSERGDDGRMGHCQLPKLFGMSLSVGPPRTSTSTTTNTTSRYACTQPNRQDAAGAVACEHACTTGSRSGNVRLDGGSALQSQGGARVIQAPHHGVRELRAGEIGRADHLRVILRRDGSECSSSSRSSSSRVRSLSTSSGAVLRLFAQTVSDGRGQPLSPDALKRADPTEQQARAPALDAFTQPPVISSAASAPAGTNATAGAGTGSVSTTVAFSAALAATAPAAGATAAPAFGAPTAALTAAPAITTAAAALLPTSHPNIRLWQSNLPHQIMNSAHHQPACNSVHHSDTDGGRSAHSPAGQTIAELARALAVSRSRKAAFGDAPTASSSGVQAVTVDEGMKAEREDCAEAGRCTGAAAEQCPSQPQHNVETVLPSILPPEIQRQMGASLHAASYLAPSHLTSSHLPSSLSTPPTQGGVATVSNPLAMSASPQLAVPASLTSAGSAPILLLNTSDISHAPATPLLPFALPLAASTSTSSTSSGSYNVMVPGLRMLGGGVVLGSSSEGAHDCERMRGSWPGEVHGVGVQDRGREGEGEGSGGSTVTHTHPSHSTRLQMSAGMVSSTSYAPISCLSPHTFPSLLASLPSLPPFATVQQAIQALNDGPAITPAPATTAADSLGATHPRNAAADASGSSSYLAGAPGASRGDDNERNDARRPSTHHTPLLHWFEPSSVESASQAASHAAAASPVVAAWQAVLGPALGCMPPQVGAAGASQQPQGTGTGNADGRAIAVPRDRSTELPHDGNRERRESLAPATVRQRSARGDSRGSSKERVKGEHTSEHSRAQALSVRGTAASGADTREADRCLVGELATAPPGGSASSQASGRGATAASGVRLVGEEERQGRQEGKGGEGGVDASGEGQIGETTGSGTRSFACEESGCWRLFKSRDNLRKHIARAHSKTARSNVCNLPNLNSGEICQFTTLDAGKMSNHKRYSLMHNRKEDFKHVCPACNGRFPRRHELARHVESCKKRMAAAAATPAGAHLDAIKTHADAAVAATGADVTTADPLGGAGVTTADPHGGAGVTTAPPLGGAGVSAPYNHEAGDFDNRSERLAPSRAGALNAGMWADTEGLLQEERARDCNVTGCGGGDDQEQVECEEESGGY